MICYLKSVCHLEKKTTHAHALTYISILTPNAVSYATKTTGYFVYHLIGPAWNAVGHISGAATDVVKQIFGAIYQVAANVGDGASDLVCEQMVQGSCSIF